MCADLRFTGSAEIQRLAIHEPLESGISIYAVSCSNVRLLRGIHLQDSAQKCSDIYNIIETDDSFFNSHSSNTVLNEIQREGTQVLDD